MMKKKSDIPSQSICYCPEKKRLILIILLVSCVFFIPVYAAQPAWKYPLSPDAPYEGNLNMVRVSDDGRYIAAYIAEENTLLYFNQAGTLLWSKNFSVERPPWISSISIAHDNSIIAVSELIPGCCQGAVSNTTSNRIILFDRNGAILWNYTTFRSPLAVTISPDSSRIYAGTDDGQVICFDRNGSIIWKSHADAPVYSLVVSGDGAMIAAAGTNPGKTSQGTVIYPNDLFIYNRTGSELWSFQTGGPNAVAISDDGSTIYAIGGKFGNLYQFSRAGNLTGERSFRDTGSSLVISKDANLIVVGSIEGSVYGLDQYGTTQWNFSATRLSRIIAVADDGSSVVFGNGSSIMMTDRNGTVLLDCPTSAWVSSVAMSEDGCTTAAMSDAIYLFDSAGCPDNSTKGDVTGKPALIGSPAPTTLTTRQTTAIPAAIPVYLPFVSLLVCCIILYQR